jgi:hypothetical protein
MTIHQDAAKAANLEDETQLLERRLWTAVLLLALDDWKSPNLRLQRAAERFLFQSWNDFARVCRGAGLAPESVLSRLQHMQGAVQPANQLPRLVSYAA